jgi:hypothetical protein
MKNKTHSIKNEEYIEIRATVLFPIVLVIILLIFYISKNDNPKAEKNKNENETILEIKNNFDGDIISSLRDLGLTENDFFSNDEIFNFLSQLQNEEIDSIHTHTGIHSVTSRIDIFCKQMVSQSDPNYLQSDLVVRCFEEMSRVSFPDKLEELLIYYKNLTQYKVWLETGFNTNYSIDPIKMEDEKWQKRYELFGMDAAEEIYASERYNKNLNQQVEYYSKGKQNITEKINSLGDYIANLKATQSNQQEISDEDYIQYGQKFLSTPEIQSGLMKLSPEKQIKMLRNIRLSVGLSESKVNELESWDKSRMSEWEKGQTYLQEINSLKDKMESNSPEFDKESRRIKETYFGKELSDEIEQEDKNGNNRFQKKFEFFLH